MTRSHGAHHLLLLSIALGGSLVACANVLGFPDRVLDESSPSPNDPDAATTGPVGLSKKDVDFGLVLCGGAAPANQTITFTNVSTAPITWTATLSTTPDFSLVGAAGGNLAAGQGTEIVIASLAVPQMAEAGDVTQATLTITTNDPQKPTIEVPVKRTAGGASIRVLPTTVDFGESQATIPAADIPIILENNGTLGVTLQFGAPEDPQFKLDWAGAPATVTVQPKMSVPSLVARFTPTAVTASSATAQITVSGGVVCGTSATQITMNGKGVASYASVQPGALDFGQVDCGTTAGPKIVKVLNTGILPFDFTTALALGATSKYTIAPETGTIAAGFVQEITVTPKTMTVPADTTSNFYGDTLTINTTATNDEPHVVDLRMGARGAVLVQSTTAANFGSVILNTTATSPLTVTNNGNVPASITFAATGNGFGVTPASAVVNAGASAASALSFKPTTETTYTGSATIGVNSTVLCSAPLAPVSLNGKGAKAATVTPGTLDFGLVSCAGQGTAKTVTFTNTGTVQFDWTGSFPKAFYTLDPSTGTLAPGASATINVTPKAIPAVSSTAADFYADTLTIQTTPALESPYISSMHMTAQGVILTFNPTSIDFRNVNVNGGSSNKNFTLSNAGNVPAPVNLTVNGTGDGFSLLSNATPTLATGGSYAGVAKFDPPSGGTKNGTITISTGAATCAALPILSLRGRGNN